MHSLTLDQYRYVALSAGAIATKAEAVLDCGINLSPAPSQVVVSMQQVSGRLWQILQLTFIGPVGQTSTSS